MAEYKGIKGFKVQTVSSDPAASIIATGTWASGGVLNTAREEGGGAGTQTAGLVFGGNTGTDSALNESYDGTSWTELADLNDARKNGSGFGTQTAALLAGGNIDTANTETWNGTSWTEVNNLNTGRENLLNAGAGITTAGLIWGGYNGPLGTGYAIVESWNGTCWTEVADLNQSRYDSSGNGTSTAALAVSGTNGAAPISNVESWNGTSWTEVIEANTPRAGSSSTGAYDNLIFVGGSSPSLVTSTEYYDGSSWTELNDLATAARDQMPSKGGTSSLAFVAGGATPTRVATTEEWTLAPPASFQKKNLGQVFYNSTSNAFKVTQQSVSSGTWASGGTMNTARRIISGAGTQTATVAMGGFAPPWVASAELYNGSTWTTTTSINTARSGIESAGTQTAAIGAGGYDGTTRLAITEEWNGTSWTEVNDLNVGRSEGGSSINGTTTATIVFSGAADPATPTSPKSTESYNGTSWTEVGDLSGPHIIGTGFGTQAAAIAAAGDPLLTTAELWNGTSWSSVSPINTGRAENLGSSGLSTSGLIFGGFTTTFVGNTESWNGSAWTEVADLATARDSLYGSGSSSSALAFGGRTAPTTASAATEEWTVPISNSTLTVS